MLTANGSAGLITGQLRTEFFQNQVSDADGGGRFATSGRQYFAATQPFTLEYDQPIAAIGFFLTGLGDVGFGRLNLTLSGGADLTIALPYTLDNAQDDAERVLFFGLTSTQSFDRVTFSFGGVAVDAYGLDDLIVADGGQVLADGGRLPPSATSAPEPVVTWTFGACIAVVAVRRCGGSARSLA